jgi:hypothetical protein
MEVGLGYEDELWNKDGVNAEVGNEWRRSEEMSTIGFVTSTLQILLVTKTRKMGIDMACSTHEMRMHTISLYGNLRNLGKDGRRLIK